MNTLQDEVVEECKARLEELARSIRAACEKLRGNLEAALPAAFVTFRTRSAQVGGLQIPWSSHASAAANGAWLQDLTDRQPEKTVSATVETPYNMQ